MQMQIIPSTPLPVENPMAPETTGKRRLSDILQNIADAPGDERIYLGSLITLFGNRAFGALIFIFAVPVALPIAVPGISAILGAPLLFLTWQLLRGRPQPWLPSMIRNRSLKRVDFTRMLGKTLPSIRWLEGLVSPRFSWLTGPLAEQIIGGLAFLLSVILFLPIPFGNMLPALAIAILALAILERDGIAVIIGTLVGFLAIGIVSGVILAILRGLIILVLYAG